MEPMSYWPVELMLDSSIIYLLTNSKNMYEIVFLGIALFMHLNRQWKYRRLIKEVSDRKSMLFNLGLLMSGLAAIWAIRTTPWPIPVWIAAAIGIPYFLATMAFVKDSGRIFHLFDPKIDVPQMLIAASMAWIAFRSHNTVSILWLTDLVYHVLELTVA